jgi:hypothetical protein
MIRRLLAVAVVTGGATLAAPAHVAGAAAPAIALTIPSSVAYGLLGHSCTPVQENVTAEGFDPTTGFPAADVTVATTCSGSGKGGGGHATYTASTGAVWDDAGHLLTLGALTSTPGAGPGFTAFDAYGNEEYQSGTTTYFQWATGFVPVPRVTGLSVTSGSTVGGESETISGSGFTNAGRVQFGSTPVAFTVVDDTTITVTTPPDAVTADTAVDVTVASSEGTSATSAADQFTYSLPTITGLSVTAGPAVGGTSETVTGVGFLGATSVDFGPLAASSFTVVDDTTITVTTPADPISLGDDTVDVSVTSAAGTGAPSSADQYTYVVAPVITSVSPDIGPLTGGTPVTITGTGLTGATSVSFGEITVYGVPTSDTSMTVTSPAGESLEAVDLSVTTIGGTSARSRADQFTYRAPIACSKLSGTLGGSITVSGCSPGTAGYAKAVLDPTGTFFTWSKSGRTTTVSLGTPTSPGQGACAKGHVEYDFSGTVAGGTSSYTTAGDPIYGTTCASKSGKLTLLGGTTFSL